MLDQTTKRKLDSARQILVGKVPDITAFVEHGEHGDQVTAQIVGDILKGIVGLDGREGAVKK